MVDRTTEVEDSVGVDLTSDLSDDTVNVAQAHGDNIETDANDDINENTLEAKPKDADLSLRDQLSSAFKSPDATKGDASDDAPKVDATTDPATPAVSELSQDAEGRWRKIDGTFASTDEVAAMNSASTANQPSQEFLGTLPANVAEQVKSLPAETQQFVASTMEDLNSRAQRYSEYDQLEQVLGPRRQAWANEGMNPLVAINQLFALSDFAGSSPAEFVLWFADQNKIDLDAELDKRDAAGQVPPEVQQLRGQVSQLSQTLAQMQQGSQQPQQNDTLNAVQNFATEKGEDGSLKRPYLSEVMSVFPSQVSAVRMANPTMPNEQVLSKAYEAACWADPSVRTKMQQEVDVQRRESAKQKVAQKRNASSSVRGGPNQGPGIMPGTSPGNRSLREELQAQFSAQGA